MSNLTEVKNSSVKLTTQPKKQDKTEIAEPNKDLFIKMNKQQALEAGDDLYQKFLIVDKDHNGEISANELLDYKGSGINEEKLDKFKNLSDGEKIVEIVDLMEAKFGPDEAHRHKNTSKEKIDINTLAAEKLGLDLTQYKTDEEKQNAIFQALQEKFSTEASNEDYENVMNDDSGKYDNNVYLQTYKKIKSGDFSNLGTLGKSLQGFEGKLTEEQIRAYAAEVTTGKQGKALISLLRNVESDDRKLISGKLSDYNVEVQTMTWGVAIASAETKEEKLKLANMFYEATKAKIDASDEIGQASTFMVSLYSSIEQSMGNVESGKFGHRAAQYNAYVITNKAELHKVETGEITQAEYDKKYSEVYAAAAYKLDNADDAYKYVSDNANDNNRSATMNTLASNAYMIKDETKRNNAISSLKTSQYYNSDVEQNLNSGYIRSLEAKAGNTSTNINSGYGISTGYSTNPTTDNYERTIISIIDSNDEQAKIDLTEKTLEQLDAKGSSVTPQEHKLRQQNAITLLNKIISNNLIQNSKYERILISKLSAKSIPTLLNMFFNCNAKVQDYFYKNHLVTPLSIAMNASDEQMKQLPDKIKESLKDYIKQPEHYWT